MAFLIALLNRDLRRKRMRVSSYRPHNKRIKKEEKKTESIPIISPKTNIHLMLGTNPSLTSNQPNHLSFRVASEKLSPRPQTPPSGVAILLAKLSPEPNQSPKVIS